MKERGHGKRARERDESETRERGHGKSERDRNRESRWKEREINEKESKRER